ncbi:MAG: cytochrome B6 [Acidimicrobiales bacterium]|nr:cytochrome B6 [Acidimicrobiales bacterium]
MAPENGDEDLSNQWSAKVRSLVVEKLPPEKLLPDTQPAYLTSWAYTFGILTISALSVVIISGTVLALSGPSWWHVSSVGQFVNSLHLWSVELFFFFMVIHLWTKFFMAAWRGGRTLTWMTGVVAFLASIGAAFTGYVSQLNFDSQWISTQAKDGLNSTGVGAYFNPLNFGQMLAFHIAILPAAVVIIVVLHLLMVRVKGIVPPLPQKRGEVIDEAHENTGGEK